MRGRGKGHSNAEDICLFLFLLSGLWRAEASKSEAQRLEDILSYNLQQMEGERLHQQQVREIEIDQANYLAQQQRAQEQQIHLFISCFPSGFYSVLNYNLQSL
jgi:hypothetical protein